MKAYERLLKYVKFSTNSDDCSDRTPSSDSQFLLAEALVEEMKTLGITDAFVDGKCYVYGHIPATAGCEDAPAIGFIAHMDTSPDFNADNCNPIITENYNGEDIVLGDSGRVIKVSEFPHLATLKGQTLITTDGTSLLGADDKAGIADILTAIERIRDSGMPHGRLCIAFTPDEEIGRGADFFDVELFGAGGKFVTSHSKTDGFGRKVFDELQLGTGFVSRKFDYAMGEATAEHENAEKLKSTATTQLVSRITFAGGRTIDYEYDAEERITKVTDSLGTTTEYTYDALGQLLTEIVKQGSDSATTVNTMTYDNYGNILTKNGVAYTYGDSAWKDLLTAIGGQSISYDVQGNPVSYLGHTLTWEKGRQLKSFDGNTYTYNANGIRTSKTVNGVKHTYTLDGTKILKEEWQVTYLSPCTTTKM